MSAEPGPFGWVGRLTRWANADRSASGATGPLPPPKARAVDPAEHELYQGMIDGWMHGTVGAALSSFFSEPRSRKELYVLYEKMDMTDLAGSVLDLYAEDATQQDAESGRTVWFEGPDEIVKECEDLAERLKLEEESTALARDIAKNGDDFERLVYRSGPEGGVMRMVPVVPLSIMRKEDKNGKLQGYQQTGKRFKNDNSETSYPWDFVHFRLRGKDRRYPYGTSVLHNGIRPWKQCLKEGSLVWSDRGYLPIEQLTTSDRVYCHDPVSKETRLTRIIACSKTGRKPIFKVRSFHRELSVTGDHPILVNTPEGFLYREAKDLRTTTNQVGCMQKRVGRADSLVLPSFDGPETIDFKLPEERCSVVFTQPVPVVPDMKGLVERLKLGVSYANIYSVFKGEAGIRYADYVALKKELDLPPVRVTAYRGSHTLPVREDLSFTVDARFARFLGFMIGDGWANSDGRGVGFAKGICNEENEFYKAEGLHAFGMSECSEDSCTDGRKGGNVVFHPNHTYDMLKAVGYISGFDKKRVPDWLFGMSHTVKRAFIRGLCDADGHDIPEGGVQLGLSNRPLIDGVMMLAQQAGMHVGRKPCAAGHIGKTSVIKSTGSVLVQRHVHWKMQLNGFDRPFEPVNYERVTAVTPDGEADVYDLTVEDPLHNFVANGVVVHNCIVMEDWMLGYQIAKHPDRNLFMLDVGTSSDVEAAQVANSFRQKLRKHMLVDPGGISGKNAGFNYAPTSPLDDVVLPIRKESATSVTKLSGSGNATEIAPLELTINKFFSAVKAPKNFFGFDSSQPTNPKASLTNQDVRYARGVKRLQRAYKQGIRYLAELNLMLKMAPGDRVESDLQKVDTSRLDWRLEGQDFKIHMSPISFLDELERLEVMQTRMQVALILMELSNGNPAFDIMNWTRYLLQDIVKVPVAKLDELLRQDLDQMAIDNIKAGMLPDGSLPGSASPGASPTKEAQSRRIPAHVLREAAKAEGQLTLDEKKLLSEAINTRPELRRLIHLSRATFKDLDESDDALVRVSPYMLPDRDSDLFRQGLLTDVLTEADLAEIAAEVMAG